MMPIVNHGNMLLMELQRSMGAFKPETALLVTFLVSICADLIFRKSKNVTGFIALVGFLITGLFLFQQAEINTPSFFRSFTVDPFSNFFKLLILITSYIIVIFSFFSNEINKEKRNLGEYFTLIVGMTFGMFLLCSSSNLVLIYLAIETMSLSSYVLAGFTKEVKRSSEASLKYVLYGAISSGIMIYGISILYGLTGKLNLYEINNVIVNIKYPSYLLLSAGLMIIAGIGYKISMVPFHFWTPDVYEGSPITITAFLSVASKAAGFAILIRFFRTGFTMFFGPHALYNDTNWVLAGSVDWRIVIAIFSVLTMTLGNLSAIWQTNIKRLLAYSSIAHAGYMLMGVVVMNEAGVNAILIYMIAYMFMNLGAFYVVLLLANQIKSEELDDYQGIGYRAPVLGICMVVFLISLTGLPPTVGFIGKLYIFSAVMKSNYMWLAIIGVLNSVVSLFYYVKIFRNMFVRGAEKNYEKFLMTPESIVIAILLVIPTLYFGLFPSSIINWANHSIKILTGM